ncbi:MAG: helix-hairpin-helix domain-containing protein, partial [Verrucomicrobiales bacterium]|nr:helix-hairpin-helix domain-containing protein [Verrucomicrobiales bacterium]
TAGRETEAFVRKLGLPASVSVVMVNESGASVYSASDVAREEFPNHDITVRGSVSIGRRLMDPLAELVKIDPKSIGVGQYQHDVDQTALKRSLDDTVTSAVNAVGVEVNTASKQLLAYVSGLGAALAENIIKFRDENGPFKSRAELGKVPRLGPKAFEQAAGFLRIRGADHPLDASAVHPESYGVVEAMAKDLRCAPADLIRSGELRAKISLEKYVTGSVGLPTLKDIVSELAKPGRDPRKEFTVFKFVDGVSEIAHLRPGMKLPGIVTNVTAFGAFVDVGVHQDGLVHISQLSDNFVKSPADIVKVQDKVQVTVTEVDAARKRIALSMRSNPDLTPGVRSGGERQRPAARVPLRPSAQDFGGLGGAFEQALSKLKR